ncbi:hypothetical protein BZA77DRAFT_293328 [Pyronema omphalodes]|nr:hypothetical protein BZA77DRAFT_293328 [Pyronema omphalodes]
MPPIRKEPGKVIHPKKRAQKSARYQAHSELGHNDATQQPENEMDTTENEELQGNKPFQLTTADFDPKRINPELDGRGNHVTAGEKRRRMEQEAHRNREEEKQSSVDMRIQSELLKRIEELTRISN